MREVDADAGGSLDFHDFVRLMEQFRELQQREQRDKELRAIEETRFSQREVEEFREHFLANDSSGTGQLSFEDIKGMLRTICPLGDKNATELQGYVQQIVAEHRRKR